MGLRGPNFDGADFAAAALARGAVGAIVERALTDVRLPYIQVPDSLKALQLLARRWREEFSIPLVGIGGSNGKTTTKEMTAAILSRRGPCLSTQGNLNNHIGVPLTLLRLERSHRSAVIEMGANRIGDVAALVALASPTVGLITNAGAEHLEGFGDLDGVARGEGEMVAGLPPGAAAVINADDAYASYWRGVATGSRIVTFGVRADADFKAKDIVQSIEGRPLRHPLHARVPARRACHRLAGRRRPQHLERARRRRRGRRRGRFAGGHRGRPRRFPRGGRPAAAQGGSARQLDHRRFLQCQSELRARRPRRAALRCPVRHGSCSPTWPSSAPIPRTATPQLGRYARECRVARLFALGPESTRAVETFGSGGEWFADADSLTRRLQSEIAPGVTVLVKGSRVNRLERVVQALLGGAASSGPMMRAS